MVQINETSVEKLLRVADDTSRWIGMAAVAIHGIEEREGDELTKWKRLVIEVAALMEGARLLVLKDVKMAIILMGISEQKCDEIKGFIEFHRDKICVEYNIDVEDL